MLSRLGVGYRWNAGVGRVRSRVPRYRDRRNREELNGENWRTEEKLNGKVTQSPPNYGFSSAAEPLLREYPCRI